MQWQKERKQESFLKLVSATQNLHFVVRFCIWLFVHYGYTFMSIFQLKNSVTFLTDQQYVDARVLQNVESRCEIHTLLDVLCDHSCCRMRHNRTDIRISLSHLSILYPVHLLTFHVIQFLHILTYVGAAQKVDFLYLPTQIKKLPILCPLYIPSKHLTALSSHTNDYWFSKQGTAHHSVTDKGAITGNFPGIDMLPFIFCNG